MILFLEDWQKHDAVLHLETRNKSAIALASKYKKMGVKNNAFFLSLYDRELINIDPHSDDLTDEQKNRILIECQRNPWYVLREIFKSPGEDRLVDFNRSIICVWWCFFNHVVVTLTHPRQTGKTFGTNLCILTCMNFLCTDTQINFLTIHEKGKKENIERLKEAYTGLPDYLKLRDRTDKSNTEEFSVLKLNNKYKTNVAPNGEGAAPNVGRSMSTSIVHIDEGPFIKYMEIISSGLFPAMSAKVDIAKRKNQPYGIILTTTAGKKDEDSGRYIYNNFVKSALTWNENLFDCENQQNLHNVIKKNSSSGKLYIYACFSYRQMGKTDEWFKEQAAKLSRQEDIDRDLLNIWTSGSISNPIPTHLLDAIKNNIRDHEFVSIEMIGNYIIRWFIPEDIKDLFMKNKKIIIGIDPSDAMGRDEISFVGIEVETGGIVFAGDFNETNILTFSQFLADWLERYVNTTMIIERRSTGPSIIDNLLSMLPLKGIDPFKRLFNWAVNDPNIYPDIYSQYTNGLNRNPIVYDKCKGLFGFATSGGGETSRNKLFSNTLQLAVKRCNDRILDRKLSQQLLEITIKNNRIDHADGKHDDLLVGWLLCHWFLTNAKNVHNYGINSSSILSNTLSNTKKEISSMSAEDIMQYTIERKIYELLEQLKTEQSDILIEKYILQIEAFQKEIKRNVGEVNNLDSLIKQIKENKTSKNLKTESLVDKFRNFYS